MIAEFVISDWKWSLLAFLGIMAAAFTVAGLIGIWFHWPVGADPDSDICHECNQPFDPPAGVTLHCGMSTARICRSCWGRRIDKHLWKKEGAKP